MAGSGHDRESLTRVLAAAGCVAAADEADALLAAAAGDTARLDDLVARRCRGEPLAWLTGHVTFCGSTVRVARGVYVPRVQSEPLARLAARVLPSAGVAVDLCTGSGAIAVVLHDAVPDATILGTEIDPVAAACARENGIHVFEGYLDEPLPVELEGTVDVMTGVLPYVPTDALHLLPRDVVAYEPRAALDGGDAGLRFLTQVIERSPRWLRPGARLLLELGGDQAGAAAALMDANGFDRVEVIRDDDGDIRGISGRLGSRAGSRCAPEPPAPPPASP